MDRRTWGDQSFETKSGKPAGEENQEVITEGELEVEASSVVLVSFFASKG